MSTAAEREKAAAAEEAVGWVRDGMTLGLGTGSTAALVVRRLGERVRGGLRIRGVPTSKATEALACEVGVPLVGLDAVTRLDLAIDGADEVDGNLALVKGGGGALLREKIVAAAATRLLVVVDSGKVKDRLGAFPLPVEVIPFGWPVVAERVRGLGGAPSLRRVREGSPFVTDEGHWILDCAFGVIRDPRGLGSALKEIPGVVEHGLFVDMTHAVLVGREDGVDLLLRTASAPGPR
jgi:ribose 5-phosphate isomerase A